MKSKVEFWNFLLNGKKDNHQGVWFSGNKTTKESITLRVISNRDGSPRWVFPVTLRNPDFLKFYPLVSLRSTIIFYIFKILFHIRLIGLVSKKVTVYYHKEPSFFSWLPRNCSQFALFAGTIGPNQKILTYSADDEGNSLFSKVAFGKSSIKLIHNEIAALYFLSRQNVQTFDYPEIVQETNNSLAIQELNVGKNINELTSGHLDSVQELYDFKSYCSPIANGTIDCQISNIQNIEPKNDVMKMLKLSLMQHHKTVKNKNKQIKMGFGHGDFTPWNCGLREGRLVILDWEMADEYPLLFDIFHFIIQDKIMNTQIDAEQIMKRVCAEMNSSKLIAFCSHNKLDWKDQLEAYLLTVSSYYFRVYHKQSEIHPQAYRAMEVWNHLLAQSSVAQGNMVMKKIFVTKLFTRLRKVEYALMKNNNELLVNHSDSSDFDLFISKEAARKTVKWIGNQPEVAKVYIQNNSYMKVASVYFKDDSFLSIDLISELKQCSSEYLSIDKIIKSTSLTIDGIKAPKAEFDLEYLILFYLLNSAPIPQKYYSYIERMSGRKSRLLLSNLKEKMKLTVESFEEFFLLNNLELRQEVKNYVRRRSTNKGISSLKNKAIYFIDTMRNLIKTRGVVVSFSGVDGAGKSTIISHVKETLENRFRKKVIVLRHRPSVLPILSAFIYGKKAAEERAANTLPRQGGNSSTFSSFLRFSYYLLDFIFGQFFVWFKYTLRGDVILYDRYYFDFIEDAKRSNITLPRWFRKVFYRFVHKPSVNVFLHAKPELILERKQELSYEDIEKLTTSYKELFKELDGKYAGKYVSIENEEMTVTLNQIESLITAAA